MRLYIFDIEEGVTCNYHSGAGLCVIADSLESALAQVRNTQNSSYLERFLKINDDAKPIAVYQLKNDEEPRVFCFPNAGCC